MAGRKRGLVLTSSVVLPSTCLAEFAAAVNLATSDIVDVVTQSAALASQKLPFPSSSYAALLSISDRPGIHSEGYVNELSRVLTPGGVLLVQEPVARRSVAPTELKAVGPHRAAMLQSQAGVERTLLLMGLSDVTSSNPVVEAHLAPEWSGITPASVGSVQGPLLQPLTLRAQKPSWEMGTSFSLKRKTKRGTASPVVEATIGGPLKLALSDMDDGTLSKPAQSAPQKNPWADGLDDEELVDEDSLLTEEDMIRPVVPVASDCGVGAARKACKNCTCGRAELEAAEQKPQAVKLTADLLNNPQSACGSCGLGDAFRCAGCPYRGLPPFQLGQKVSLPSSMLAADV